MSVIPNLEAMLSNGQDNALLRFGLGNAYLQINKPKEAIKHYHQSLNQDNSYPATWKMYAQALDQLAQTAEAKSAYLRGIAAAKAKGDDHLASEMAACLKRLNAHPAPTHKRSAA
jgi:predicted Zn-dependent protease